MDYELTSNRLKAMGHPTRLRILSLLRESGSCVQDLENKLGLKQSNVSQHLRILRDLGLVCVTREGHTVCYRINAEVVAPLLDRLEDQA